MTATEASTARPDRPRLLCAGPVLWRRVGQLQLGWGETALVLDGVPTDLAQAVALLDGRHSRSDLARAIGPDWAAWLIDALMEQNVLTDGPAPPPPPLRISVLGQGDLAQAVTTALGGVAELTTVQPDLVVWADARLEPDRVELADLTARRLPHLIARAGGGRASLGPFVLPGTTSCLTCLDLGRRQLDPDWPLLAFQLAQRPARPEPLQLAWVSGLVAGEVSHWRAGRLPETCAAVVELDPDRGQTGWTPWPPHPDCPCQAHAHGLAWSTSRGGAL
ncbi:MAG: TOMM precursor leader peptide-binding protein [Propionibacteriaceae bacterium]|nr:TOMM precursor leader peptide-binding protein [Propionibacteriaceae bacterium]